MLLCRAPRHRVFSVARISGDPNGDAETMVDPGFRQPVRKLSYVGVSLTGNQQQLTPDNSYTIPRRSCTQTQSCAAALWPKPTTHLSDALLLSRCC